MDTSTNNEKHEWAKVRGREGEERDVVITTALYLRERDKRDTNEQVQ